MKLSKYRTGGDNADGGDRGDAGGFGEAEMPRELLSNTDKEVIFDGLKKLYRKKVRPPMKLQPLLIVCVIAGGRKRTVKSKK